MIQLITSLKGRDRDNHQWDIWKEVAIVTQLHFFQPRASSRNFSSKRSENFSTHEPLTYSRFRSVPAQTWKKTRSIIFSENLPSIRQKEDPRAFFVRKADRFPPDMRELCAAREPNEMKNSVNIFVQGENWGRPAHRTQLLLLIYFYTEKDSFSWGTRHIHFGFVIAGEDFRSVGGKESIKPEAFVWLIDKLNEWESISEFEWLMENEFVEVDVTSNCVLVYFQVSSCPSTNCLLSSQTSLGSTFTSRKFHWLLCCSFSWREIFSHLSWFTLRSSLAIQNSSRFLLSSTLYSCAFLCWCDWRQRFGPRERGISTKTSMIASKKFTRHPLSRQIKRNFSSCGEWQLRCLFLRPRSEWCCGITCTILRTLWRQSWTHPVTCCLSTRWCACGIT